MGDFKEKKYKAGEVPSEFSAYEVVEHRIGNQTNAEDNNNKFFSIELCQCKNDWFVYTNYGRVDDREFTGAVGIYGAASESEMRNFFEKKFSEKVRPSKGYVEVKFIKAKVGSPKARLKVCGVSENEIPDDKKKKLNESDKKTKTPKSSIQIHPIVKKMVEQWYRENGHAITSNSAVQITSDGIVTPLGVLTFGTVASGRKILGEITDAIKNKDSPEVKRLTGSFFSVIPTKFGRKILDTDLITTDDIVQQKLDLLDMMDSALEVGGATFTSDTENKFAELGIVADYIEPSDSEYKRLDKKVQESRANNHYGVKSKVRSILKVKLNADSNRYDSCNIGNEQELWHGSRNCNILGILKKGLLIAPPEAPVSGYMFDKGIYLASASTKSLNYSLYSFPNMDNPNNCFMFVVRGKLGKQLKLSDSDGSAKSRCKREGCDSTWGVKGRSLYNDEYIVYTLDQAKITHIIEIER
jgi:poly [ADP-ribose] polymerase